MRRGGLLILAAIVVFMLSGCGETVSGIGKDTGRIGRGVRTVFIRDDVR